MAKKKQPKRISNVPRRAKKLRNGDPDSFEWRDDLEEFCQDRDTYIKAYRGRVSDFLELSPMSLVWGWTRNDIPDTGRESLMTRQERAARKGRRIERRKRQLAAIKAAIKAAEEAKAKAKAKTEAKAEA